MAEALYRTLEFTTDVGRVWERLRSGWDWVGFTEEREFVLGYPPRKGRSARPADITITMPGAQAGEHGVRIESPVAATTVRWYPAEAQAREEYERVAHELQRERRGPPTLVLVQRVEGGDVAEEMFVTPTEGAGST